MKTKYFILFAICGALFFLQTQTATATNQTQSNVTCTSDRNNSVNDYVKIPKISVGESTAKDFLKDIVSIETVQCSDGVQTYTIYGLKLYILVYIGLFIIGFFMLRRVFA